jgi:hypothetical protein
METRDRNYYIKAVVSTTKFDFAYIQTQNSVRYLGNLQSKKEKNEQSPGTVTSVMQSRTAAATNTKQRCVRGLSSDCRPPVAINFLQAERLRLRVT